MEDIEALIKNYTPSKESIELINQLKIVFLVGISGAGKDTIIESLLKSGNFHRIVTHTTRLPRYNNGQMEVDGISRHFIDETKAIQMLKNHEFIEAKFVHGKTVYGTSVKEFEYAKSENKIVIANIDIQGVEEYIKIAKNIIPIFIIPPSYDVWLNRLKNRYNTEAEFQADWPNRKNSAIKEILSALQNHYYKFIINDELKQAVNDTNSIINGSVNESKQEKAIAVANKILTSFKTS